MSDPPEWSTPARPPHADPARPTPDRSVPERVRSWLVWFGTGRLVATSVSVLIVAAGGFWLVRAPAPPAESALPHAAESFATAVSTSDPFAGSGSALVPGTVADSGGLTEESVVSTGPIIVHVAGHVAAPGVYRLDVERRVDDAIRLAGGPLPDADLDAVNLAQLLFDGQRLYVPAVGSDIDPRDTVTPLVASPEPGHSAEGGPVALVDVNRATVEELESLPGVGPSTAKAIVDERERNGPFTTVDDLERVPGIGPAKLAALRDLVTV